MEPAKAIFGIPTGDASYSSTGSLIFGADYGNQDFVVPMAKFMFYDAKGNQLSTSSAPTIYVRLGGTFNSSLLNGWQEAQGIMGNPTGDSIFQSEFGQAIGRLGSSWIEGLQKQIVQGVAGATGYVASAGQSGKSQIEFLQRIMLNNFQQLIYQGPSFRRFQLPFNMKPHSQDEAETMLQIISSFRIASSPRTGTETSVSNVIDSFAPGGRGEGELERTGNETLPKEDDEAYKDDPALYQEALRDYYNRQAVLTTEAEGAVDEIVRNSGSVFTFGYPDMVKFDLVLYRSSAAKIKSGVTEFGEIDTLFRSEFCMIESVSVDYGASNKMTFFDGTKGQYFPTDVNLTISLRESVLITAPKATQQYLSNTVLL